MPFGDPTLGKLVTTMLLMCQKTQMLHFLLGIRFLLMPFFCLQTLHNPRVSSLVLQMIHFLLGIRFLFMPFFCLQTLHNPRVSSLVPFFV